MNATSLACLAAMISIAAVSSADTIYVNGSTGSDAWDGLCQVWDGGTGGPKATIQTAILNARDGDEIVVADGTHVGRFNKVIEFGGLAITLRSANGPQNCLIDCEGDGRAFKFRFGEGPDSIVDGFALTGGDVTSFSGGGGAVHCSGSSPTIRGCVISHNVAYQGGGIASWSCSPCVVDCTIIGNTAATFGGGFYCYQSSPIIDHCLIASNSAPNDGGGLNLSGCHAAIVNCVMPGNRSSGNEGGAIHSQGGNVSISDCLITNNFAWSAGGGLAGSGIDPAIALTGGLTCLLPGSGGLALRSQIDHVARTAYGSTEGANAVIAMFELRLCSAESLEWAPCVNPRYAADRTVPSTR